MITVTKNRYSISSSRRIWGERKKIKKEEEAEKEGVRGRNNTRGRKQERKEGRKKGRIQENTTDYRSVGI